MFGFIVYFLSCIYIAKANVTVRSKIKGKVVLEYIVWLAFIILYIPYSIFFPAWLSECLVVWERTPDLTAAMIILGCGVSAIAIFKAGPIHVT